MKRQYLDIRRVWRYQRVIGNRKSKKDRQHNGQKKQRKKDKQRSTKHYTEKYCAPERWAVPAPLVALVVLLYLQTQYY
jgi:hypothetical protein